MPRRLTPQEESEARECFAIYGKDGMIPTSALGSALRSLGVNPTNAEIKALADELGNPQSIDFSTFLRLLTKDFTPADSAEEIQEAFGVFDKDGNGSISATELKHVLMTMGEKLTEEEVEIMIHEADIDGEGQIYYQQFIDIMTKK
ncbi:calmodulin-like [Macrobrachium rosenbergii]|uniref:calmodulin-like n=1 Tax=Macrobrachium rosenbergii TaxID=79674 RepID=UPI0034D4A66E